jgi:adenosylcobyric acid synthase
MLGRTITDTDGIEGPAESVQGLGLLPLHTRLAGLKQVREVRGRSIASGAEFDGYEIHVGQTHIEPGVHAWLRFDDGTPDGAVSADGKVSGCYVHGLFNRAEFRGDWLRSLGTISDRIEQDVYVNAALDELAAQLERTIAFDRLLDIAGYRP